MTGRLAAGRLLAVGVALLAILAATLTPAGYSPSTTPATCLFCGVNGAADAVNNILLFVPLGVTLALAGVRPAAVIGVALALSMAVEALQLTVISRHASLGDVVWNTAGAAIGLGLVRLWPRVAPSDRDGPRPALMASAGCVLLVAILAVLLTPQPPGGPWYIHWLRNQRYVERYRGHIVDATVGGQRLAPWRELHPEQARAALAERGLVVVDVGVGPPPRSLAALLTLLGPARQEVLYVGVSGNTVVEREHRIASTLKFRTPAGRAPGALAGFAPGDTVRLTIEGAGTGRCLTVEEHRLCGFDPPLNRTWSLLVGTNLPRLLLAAIDGAWMMLLFAPVGLFAARRYLPLAAGVALGGGLLAVPLLVRTVSVSWSMAVLAALGVAAGALLRAVVTSRSVRSS